MKIKTTGIELLKLVLNCPIETDNSFCDIVEQDFCENQIGCENCPCYDKTTSDEIEIEIPDEWVE